MAWLDYDGLLYFWQKIKAKLADKVDKVDGKGLSTNDFSAAYKAKLDGIANGANNYSHPTSSGNKHIPAGGSAGQILRWSSDGTAQWGNDNNTTYSAFKGATSSAAGGSGLVPAPTTTNATQYLRGDGTWATPPDTKYNNASTSSAGLMSSGDKAKLDGIAANANNYAHPTSAGNKHIPAGGSAGQILRWSADGTAQWGNDNNTTYSDMKGATTEAAGVHGLAPAPAAGAANRYLCSDGTWKVPPDTNTTYGTFKAAILPQLLQKMKVMLLVPVQPIHLLLALAIQRPRQNSHLLLVLQHSLFISRTVNLLLEHILLEMHQAKRFVHWALLEIPAGQIKQRMISISLRCLLWLIGMAHTAEHLQTCNTVTVVDLARS